ncbi:uncharacterized protein LOC116297130 [Actinia tenebrosa]|uniref:Uncharacterized protein LOC116297130 n=1 Tax=Actinia tenebrosa TaxID=6105 RepID=A0A6P8I0B1_ACTTE|nr:uncharacterized protein LOC116297130 [Actinia tenebrosa]
MQCCDLQGILNLQSYPLNNPNSTHYKDLIQRLRAELQANGIVLLPNFMTKTGIDSTLRSLQDKKIEPYRKEVTHNVYLEDHVRKNEEEFPNQNHPKRFHVRSCKTCYTNDQIDSKSPINVLFYADEMTDFIRDVLGKEKLYRTADPLGALNVHMYKEGDELGWHFDRGEFAVTLLLQAPESGGKFEFYPDLRSEQNSNYPKVQEILLAAREGQDVSKHGVQVADQLEAGTLSIFCGHNSLHRVTKIVGQKPRYLAVLSYENEPNVHLNEYTKMKFFGRIQ